MCHTEEDQDEQDRDDFTAFQDRYSDVHGHAVDALDNERSTEEARLKALASKQKVQQYQAGWKAVHTRIEKALEDIETSLGGEAIATLEELEVEEVQLRQVKESLEESASLVDAIISEDPNQTEAMNDAEATKSVSADSKIRACRKRLASFRARINKASNTGAAAPATTEAPAAPASRPAPIGPRFERRKLPAFRSGELRDYPTFKSDWTKMVHGYFEPAEVQ